MPATALTVRSLLPSSNILQNSTTSGQWNDVARPIPNNSCDAGRLGDRPSLIASPNDHPLRDRRPSKAPLSATITSLIDEPFFLSNFDQEDSEDITPTTSPAPAEAYGSSKMSFMSAVSHCSSVDDSDFELNFPELLHDDDEGDFFVDTTCVRAQPIRVVATGKPTLIELMRSSKPKPTVRVVRPRPWVSPIQPSFRKERSTSSSKSSNSDRSNRDSSDEAKYESSATSADEGSSKPRFSIESTGFSSETPSLDAVAESPTSDYSPQTPVNNVRVGEYRYPSHKVSDTSLWSSASASPPSAKSHGPIASRLRAFGRRARGHSNASSTVASPVPAPGVKLYSVQPAGPPPTRQAPTKPQRLVARGATEREPTMQIPPLSFDDEYDYDGSDSSDVEPEFSISRILTARNDSLTRPSGKAHLVARGPCEREPMMQLPPSPSDDDEDACDDYVNSRVPIVERYGLSRPTLSSKGSQTASQAALSRRHRIRRVESTVGLNQQY